MTTKKVENVTKLEVGGEEYQVGLLVTQSYRGDPSTSFYAKTKDGAQVEGESIEALRKKLTQYRRTTAVKLDIPFMVHYHNGVQWGVYRATGIHGRTNNLMVRTEDGKSEQYDLWGYGEHYHPPKDAEEKKELLDLITVRDKAQKALDAWLNKRKFNLKEAVTKALGAVEEE